MRKLVKRVWFCFLLAVLVWCGTLIADRQRLHEELVRLHVVAASDSWEDQLLKLRVRDAVMESLTEAMADVGDVEQAKVWLRENLTKIERVANEALRAAGCEDIAAISFDAEAGVYETLRITIGEGQGANWWCVVFPAQIDQEDVSAGAGFPDSLSAALTGEDGYEIRFFLLDVLGKLENFLWGG